jgi:hypothetical protein
MWWHWRGGPRSLSTFFCSLVFTFNRSQNEHNFNKSKFTAVKLKSPWRRTQTASKQRLSSSAALRIGKSVDRVSWRVCAFRVGSTCGSQEADKNRTFLCATPFTLLMSSWYEMKSNKPWRRRNNFLPKRLRTCTVLHGVTSHYSATFIHIVVSSSKQAPIRTALQHNRA